MCQGAETAKETEEEEVNKTTKDTSPQKLAVTHLDVPR